MISGYFLTAGGVVTLNSLMKRLKGVWWRAFLCSVLVYIVLVAFTIAPFDKNELLKSFFPIIEHRYWFITVFALLALIRPFWGKALLNLKNKELLLLVLVLLFFDSIQADVIAGSKMMVIHYLFTVVGFVAVGILVDVAGCYVTKKVECITKRLSKRDSNGK